MHAVHGVSPGARLHPPATLAQRLGELESAGVLRREVRDARPPHVEYVLTTEGLELRSLLDALTVWARA